MMELAEYKNVYRNEGSHFFYVSTHHLIEKLVKKISGGRRLAILDAGCGTGLLARKLTRFGDVRALDSSAEAVKYAKKNGVPARLGSINQLPYKDNTFDLVTSVDVIYHRRVNDRLALGELNRVLKPGGILILRVPANKFLMSAHDRQVHAARRYDRKELLGKLRRAGLAIKLISYIHSPIFPMSLIRVMREKLTHQSAVSAVGKVNPVLNAILIMILRLEAEMVSGGVAMPFGQGLIAVATPNRRNNLEQKKR